MGILLNEVMERISKKRTAQKQTGQKKEETGITCRSNISDELLERYGIYRRYAKTTFEDVRERGIPKDLVKQYEDALGYAEEIDKHLKDGTGLIFAGACGTMKTTLAVCILRAMMDTPEGEYRPSGLFIPMVSLIDTLYNMRNASKEEAAAFEKRIRSVDLLVLDDLGGENTEQNWVKAKVDSIITERYNRMKPVIITTNLSPTQLYEVYGARVLDRIKETTRIVIHAGKSLRKPA